MEDVNHCCLFCYRTFTKEVVTPRENGDGKIQVQFLLLLKRYLIQGCDTVQTTNWIKILSDSITSSESLRKLISTCDVCSGIIKSFCKYYQEMKVLEMKLKWKLESLAGIVENSEKMQSRQGILQEKLEGLDFEGVDVLEFMKQLKDFRAELVAKCTRTSGDCFPKVKLKRCDSSFEGTTRTLALKRPHEDVDVTTDDYPNPIIKVPKFEHFVTCSNNDIDPLLPDILNEPNLKVEPSEQLLPVKETVWKHEALGESESRLILEPEANFINIGEIFKTIKIIPEDDDDDNHDMTGAESDTFELGEFTCEAVSNDKINKNEDMKSHKEGFKEESTEDKINREKVVIPKHNDNELHNEIKNYACCFCNMSSFTRVGLIYHQNQVHRKIQLDQQTTAPSYSYPSYKSDQVFKCPVPNCPETFMCKENLEAHAKLHGNFKCQFCDISVTYAPDLAIHEATYHKRQKKSRRQRQTKTKTQLYSCARCSFQECREIIYLQHFLRAHLNLTLVVGAMCCICKRIFHSQKRVGSVEESIAKHYDIHHNPENIKSGSGSGYLYRCEREENDCDCDAYFLTEEQLMLHKFLFHNERRKYPCPVCKKEFLTKNFVHEHVRRKHKYFYTISCSEDGCQYRFPDETSMKRHVSIRHSKETSNSVCAQCGKSFRHFRSVVRHCRTVHASDMKPKSPTKRNKNDLKSRNKRSLDSHVINVHASNKKPKTKTPAPPKRKKCGFKSKKKRTLNSHVIRASKTAKPTKVAVAASISIGDPNNDNVNEVRLDHKNVSKAMTAAVGAFMQANKEFVNNRATRNQNRSAEAAADRSSKSRPEEVIQCSSNMKNYNNKFSDPDPLDLEDVEAECKNVNTFHGDETPFKATSSLTKEIEDTTYRRVSLSLRQLYQCTTCSKNFASSDNLLEHGETCANNADKSVDHESESGDIQSGDEVEQHDFHPEIESMDEEIEDPLNPLSKSEREDIIIFGENIQGE